MDDCLSQPAGDKQAKHQMIRIGKGNTKMGKNRTEKNILVHPDGLCR